MNHPSDSSDRNCSHVPKEIYGNLSLTFNGLKAFGSNVIIACKLSDQQEFLILYIINADDIANLVKVGPNIVSTISIDQHFRSIYKVFRENSKLYCLNMRNTVWYRSYHARSK